MMSFEKLLQQMLPTQADNYFSETVSAERSYTKMPDVDGVTSQKSPVLDDPEIFPEYPKTGPLARYRQDATFDWKKLKLMVEDEDGLLLRKKIWGLARQHPVFQRTMSDSLTMDEQRHLATKRMMLGHQQLFFGVDEVSTTNMIGVQFKV